MMFNNEQVPMTRRYPPLPNRILRRDSEIVKRLVEIGDNGRDDQAVFDLFMKEHKNLSDYRYWEILRTVWIMAGKVERLDQFRKWFLSDRKQRFYFSTPEEAKRLRELNYPVRIFRATNDENDGGFSWTLSGEYADSYRSMFGKLKIVSRLLNKGEAFALIERNKEDEILIIK